MRILLAAFAVIAVASSAAAEETRPPAKSKIERRSADATPAANKARAPIRPAPAAHPGESPRAESLFMGPPPLPLVA